MEAEPEAGLGNKKKDVHSDDSDDSNSTTKDAKRFSLPKQQPRRKKRKSKHTSRDSPDAYANKNKKPKNNDNKAPSDLQANKTDDAPNSVVAQAPQPTNTCATPSTPLSVEVILEGVDGGTQSCGTVTWNGITGGTETDANNLCIRGILTTRDDAPQPLLVSYTAYWGPHLTLSCFA